MKPRKSMVSRIRLNLFLWINGDSYFTFEKVNTYICLAADLTILWIKGRGWTFFINLLSDWCNKIYHLCCIIAKFSKLKFQGNENAYLIIERPNKKPQALFFPNANTYIRRTICFFFHPRLVGCTIKLCFGDD